MLYTLAKKIAVFLYDETDMYSIDVYIYGIELIISSLIDTLVLCAIGLFLKVIFETLIFIIFFSILRFYTGGYHAETFLRCSMVTLIIYFSVMSIYELLLNINKYHIMFVSVLLLLSTFLLIIAFVPIENKNKVLICKRKFKIISLIYLFLELMIFFIGYHGFGFNKLLVLLPTILSVDILMIVELMKKRGEKNDKVN